MFKNNNVMFVYYLFRVRITRISAIIHVMFTLSDYYFFFNIYYHTHSRIFINPFIHSILPLMAKLKDRPNGKNGLLAMKEEKGYRNNKLQEFRMQIMKTPNSTG